MALGYFDGLHRGHLAVLQKAGEIAAQTGMERAVLLFNLHPKAVLGGNAPALLMTQEEKTRMLREMGFTVCEICFEAWRDLSPEAFLQKIHASFGVRAVCFGGNYRFGRNASGNTETLQTLCPALGITPYPVNDALFLGAPISSTRIRTALQSGTIEEANAMLGRPFSYRLQVVSGDRRGRLLGFPTINQFFPQTLVRPRAGVYASKVQLKGTWYPAVTNIGVRPTIGTGDFRSETCILGFSGDLYNKMVEVHLLCYLRPEQKCESLSALQSLIQQDAAAARAVFEEKTHDEEPASESGIF